MLIKVLNQVYHKQIIVKDTTDLIIFYHCFIPYFANIAGLLTDLTSKAIALTWESRHKEAFMNLKKVLVSPPLVDCPPKNDQVVLFTDASDSVLCTFFLLQEVQL